MAISDRLPRSDIDQKHKPDRCQHCGQPWKGLTPVKTIVGAIKLLMRDQPPLWWWSDDDLERMAAELTPGAQLLNLYAFSARFQLATGEVIEVVRRDPVGPEAVDWSADPGPLCRSKDEGRGRIGR